MYPPIVTSFRSGVLALALLMSGALGVSGTAHAAPATAVGKFLTFSVDDASPVAGQVITLEWIYKRSINDDEGLSARLGFGTFPDRDVDLSDLVPVAGSCGGEMSNCAMVSEPWIDFAGDIPVGSDGDLIEGTAKFAISPNAPAGETFELIAWHEVTKAGYKGTTSTVELLEIAVAPSADLDVSLSAWAPVLGSRVVYKVTAINNGPEAVSAATIDTQLSARALSLSAGSPCALSSSLHQVSCPVGALPRSSSSHITFAVNYSLFGNSPLPATAMRTVSSPLDPNASNDADSANCTGVIPLIISC